jgi:hypothetical protein
VLFESGQDGFVTDSSVVRLNLTERLFRDAGLCPCRHNRRTEEASAAGGFRMTLLCFVAMTAREIAGKKKRRRKGTAQGHDEQRPIINSPYAKNLSISDYDYGCLTLSEIAALITSAYGGFHHARNDNTMDKC